MRDRPKPTTIGQASRRLTKDWASQFPELSIFRSRELVRRVGPLLQGVVLDRSSDGRDYIPTSYVHVLAWPSEVIVFGLWRRLRSAYQGHSDWISVRFHDQEFEDAAARLRQQAPLPFDRVPTLPEVLDAFRDDARRAIGPFWAPGINEVEWLVLLAGAAGDRETVEACVEFSRSISARWRPDWCQWAQRDPDWLDQLAARARDPVELKRVVDAEVERHKLTMVNTVEMPPAPPG